MFGFPRLRALIAEHGEEGYLGGFLMEELSSYCRGGVGAGGRHHPPYAATLRISKLNFLELRQGELLRIHLLRLSEKGRRSLLCSLTEHRNATFRSIFASLHLRNPR